MMKKLVISALLLGASVCQAVTIGTQTHNPAPIVNQQRSVQPKKATTQTKQRSTVKKTTPSDHQKVTVKHYHHYHHHYHYPQKPAGTRYIRRKVYHHVPRRPTNVHAQRHYQPRVAYSAPIPGAGLHFVIR